MIINHHFLVESSNVIYAAIINEYNIKVNNIVLVILSVLTATGV